MDNLIKDLFVAFVSKAILELTPEDKQKAAEAMGISYFTMMNKAHGRGKFSAEQLEAFKAWQTSQNSN